MDTEIALALAQLGESTDRLLATADALTDAQAAGAVPAARLDPRPRADPSGPQRRRLPEPAHLGWYRERDADVPQ